MVHTQPGQWEKVRNFKNVPPLVLKMYFACYRIYRGKGGKFSTKVIFSQAAHEEISEINTNNLYKGYENAL